MVADRQEPGFVTMVVGFVALEESITLGLWAAVATRPRTLVRVHSFVGRGRKFLQMEMDKER